MSTIKALRIIKTETVGIARVSALGLRSSRENTYKSYAERNGKDDIINNMFPDVDLEKISVVEYVKIYRNTKTT